MALYELLLDKFFKENAYLKRILSTPVSELQEACTKSIVDRGKTAEGIRNVNDHLLQTLTDENVLDILRNWEAEKCSSSSH